MMIAKVLFFIGLNNLVAARPEWKWVPYVGETTGSVPTTPSGKPGSTQVTTMPAETGSGTTMPPKWPKKIKFDGQFNIDGNLNVHIMPGQETTPDPSLTTTPEPTPTGTGTETGSTGVTGTGTTGTGTGITGTGTTASGGTGSTGTGKTGSAGTTGTGTTGSAGSTGTGTTGQDDTDEE